MADRRSVEVSGLPSILYDKDFITDQLLLYFLRRRNGGGDVTAHYPTEEVGAALLEFEDERVAQRILGRTHTLIIHDCMYPLEVRRPQPRGSQFSLPVRTSLDLSCFSSVLEVKRLLEQHRLRIYQDGGSVLGIEGDFCDLKICRLDLYKILCRQSPKEKHNSIDSTASKRSPLEKVSRAPHSVTPHSVTTVPDRKSPSSSHLSRIPPKEREHVSQDNINRDNSSPTQRSSTNKGSHKPSTKSARASTPTRFQNVSSSGAPSQSSQSISSSGAPSQSSQNISSSRATSQSFQNVSSPGAPSQSSQNISSSGAPSQSSQSVSSPGALPQSFQNISSPRMLSESSQNVSSPRATSQSSQNVSSSRATSQSSQNVSPGAASQSSQNVSSPGALSQSSQNVSPPGTLAQSSKNVSSPGALPQSSQNVSSPRSLSQSSENVSPLGALTQSFFVDPSVHAYLRIFKQEKIDNFLRQHNIYMKAKNSDGFTSITLTSLTQPEHFEEDCLEIKEYFDSYHNRLRTENIELMLSNEEIRKIQRYLLGRHICSWPADDNTLHIIGPSEEVLRFIQEWKGTRGQLAQNIIGEAPGSVSSRSPAVGMDNKATNSKNSTQPVGSDGRARGRQGRHEAHDRPTCPNTPSLCLPLQFSLPVRTSLDLSCFSSVLEVKRLLEQHRLRIYQDGGSVLGIEGDFCDLKICRLDLYKILCRQSPKEKHNSMDSTASKRSPLEKVSRAPHIVTPHSVTTVPDWKSPSSSHLSRIPPKEREHISQDNITRDNSSPTQHSSTNKGSHKPSTKSARASTPTRFQNVFSSGALSQSSQNVSSGALSQSSQNISSPGVPSQSSQNVSSGALSQSSQNVSSSGAPSQSSQNISSRATSQSSQNVSSPRATSQSFQNISSSRASSESSQNVSSPRATSQSFQNVSPEAASQSSQNVSSPGALSQSSQNVSPPGALSQSSQNVSAPRSLSQSSENVSPPGGLTQSFFVDPSAHTYLRIFKQEKIDNFLRQRNIHMKAKNSDGFTSITLTSLTQSEHFEESCSKIKEYFESYHNRLRTENIELMLSDEEIRKIQRYLLGRHICSLPADDNTLHIIGPSEEVLRFIQEWKGTRGQLAQNIIGEAPGSVSSRSPAVGMDNNATNSKNSTQPVGSDGRARGRQGRHEAHDRGRDKAQGGPSSSRGKSSANPPREPWR